MSGPARRAAERQSARRTTSARASTISAKAGATRPATSKPGSPKAGAARATTAKAAATASAAMARRPSLTGRAVVLAGVLALIVFTLAVPTRELIAQRADINALRAQNEAAQSRVDALVVRQERLQDPAYVTSLIRERLHYVMPGEVGYVVLDPSEAPAPSTAKKATAPVAWYGTLWKSVQTTDGAAGDDAKTVIPVRTNAPR
ncbi:MAG: septum formation initiator family protein [Candidatus Nanopelagicales bacterium]